MVVFGFFSGQILLPNLNSGYFGEGHFPYNHHHLGETFQARRVGSEWLPVCQRSELRCDCRRADTWYHRLRNKQTETTKRRQWLRRMMMSRNVRTNAERSNFEWIVYHMGKQHENTPTQLRSLWYRSVPRMDPTVFFWWMLQPSTACFAATSSHPVEKSLGKIGRCMATSEPLGLSWFNITPT